MEGIIEMNKFKKLLRNIYLILLIPCALVSCHSKDNQAVGEIDIKTDSSTKQNSSVPIQQLPPLPPEKYEGKSKNEIGLELMYIEELNGLKYGLAGSEVVALIGQPDSLSEALVWGADGMTHQTWYYLKKGIEIDMLGEMDVHDPSLTLQNNLTIGLTIDMITIKAPCNFKTKRRVGIGSSADEVKTAYKKAYNKKESDTGKIVAGTVFGGIIFELENNFVKSIFLGAASE